MALNPSTNATMAGRITAVDGNYPYGSSKDETAPAAGDGTPYFKGRADDIFGFQQALLKAAGIVPSGNAETALESEYLKAIVDLTGDSSNFPTLANSGGDVDHDIIFGTGFAKSFSTKRSIRVASALTKRIDAAWIVGNGNGGLFNGTVSANTTYHCFVIKDDSTGTVDAGFDTDVNAANRPSAYTSYRRVGSIITDGAANIYGFRQFGDYFMFESPKSDVSESPASINTRFTRTMSVPRDVQPVGLYLATLFKTGAGAVDLTIGETFLASTRLVVAHPNVAADKKSVNEVKIVANANSQIDYTVTQTTVGVTVAIATFGWIDKRG